MFYEADNLVRKEHKYRTRICARRVDCREHVSQSWSAHNTSAKRIELAEHLTLCMCQLDGPGSGPTD
ncbi:hypothetical protein N7471_013522 [Penicillium samsonianum]|uniref:uncharacterized protein n=1 Tax=Penicillium samsonianum TaxID=1882272 RepID=UPI00254806D1|nr:uncharacterized protein N7471_013522 [Penicillium samsonianum]KAJ6118902.1 hypothetical protein N7471_013522 [Penicillium samsonianum]